MRSPPQDKISKRDVKDDDVDRSQVYRQQCHSRAKLITRNFPQTAGRADRGACEAKVGNERKRTGHEASV